MRWLAVCFAVSACVNQRDAPVDPGAREADLAVAAPTAPDLGTAQRMHAPPPLSGGTLAAFGDHFAIASDPDTDRVYIIDVTAGVVQAVQLEPGDEPGRITVDSRHAFVALRRGGAVVTIDLAKAVVLDRRTVCPAPRGVAYDPSTDLVWVACTDGELIALPAAGGPPWVTRHLPDDLRDVAIIPRGLLVSRFRSPDRFLLDPLGNLAFDMPLAQTNGFVAGVAWRMVASSGISFTLHQRSSTATIDLVSGIPADSSDGGVDAGAPSSCTGYGCSASPDACGGGAVVQSTISMTGAGGLVPQPFLAHASLAIDIAVSTDGSTVALAAPGGRDGAQLLFVSTDDLLHSGRCTIDDQPDGGAALFALSGQAIAVVALGPGFVFQTRQPARLLWVPDWRSGTIADVIPLGDSPPDDPGHALFHADPGIGIVCASCHPEGGDDGRVWNFSTGPRRTMSLRGGLRGTEPFHWDGADGDLAALMSDVFVGRMHGMPPSPSATQALSDWLETIPLIPIRGGDPDAIWRGKALFEDPFIGCSGCHSGPHLTNNATVDVGTGGAFQVPRLTGLAARAPYLHDGCAQTILDRLTLPSCAGSRHGSTNQLLPSDLDDLAAYLSSL